MTSLKRVLLILVWMFVLTETTQAQSLLPQFSWTEPSDTIAFNRAVNAYYQANYDGCVTTIKRMPVPLREQAATQRLMGLCLSGAGDFAGATDAFTAAILFDPEALGLYADRALSYIYREQYPKAIPDLRLFLKHLPGQKQAALNLAYCLYQIDSLGQAITVLEEFPEVANDTIMANTLGWYYIENENYGKAIFLLEPLLQRHPHFADGYETLSIAFSQLGYTPEAIQAANILIDLLPDYGRAYFLKGVYLEEAYREDEAEQQFRIARRLGYSWE